MSDQTWTPQEGHIPASPELENVDLRLSIFPTVRGEKIVIRLFDQRTRSFDLGTLGFDLPALRTFIELITRPTGLILLTGPTGSGKTTAIYAALTHLVHRSGPAIRINTVEDPQIIMIGEIRDPETASIAVQAGLTGHLVISTIHSGTTAGVFARLMHLEIEPFLLASSAAGVLGLRLIRTNCQLCAEPYEPEPSLARLLPAGFTDNAYFRRGAGCSSCQGTGFDGRAALTELLVVNERIREAVLAKVPTRALQEVAESEGMFSLAASGLARVARGETTLEELARVVALGAA